MRTVALLLCLTASIAAHGQIWIGVGNIGTGGAQAMVVANDHSQIVATSTNGLYRCVPGDSVWVHLSTGTSTNFQSLCKQTDGTLFAGCLGVGVWKSTNNGADWAVTSAGLPTNVTVTSLYVDHLNVVYAGTNSGLYQSLNSGGNWSIVSTSGITTSTRSIVESNGLLFVAYSAGVKRYNYSTQVWSIVSTVATDRLAAGLSTTSTNVLYSTSTTGVRRSLDNGDTWTLLGTGIFGTPYGIYLAQNGQVYVGTTSGGNLYRSTDDATSWTLFNQGLGSIGIRFIMDGQDGYLYCGGTNALAIYRTINIVPGVGVNDPQTSLQPVTHDLIQCYPNPFNSTIKIRFRQASAANVNVSVFESTGRKVATLTNEFIQPGEHTLEWSPNGIPSGSYFVRMQDGKSTQQRQVIYLK